MKDSFKDLTFDELLTKREELRVKYRDIRFNTVVGHVDNPLEKRTVRRKITRLNTLIYNHPDVVNLGGDAPSAAEPSGEAAGAAQATGSENATAAAIPIGITTATDLLKTLTRKADNKVRSPEVRAAPRGKACGHARRGGTAPDIRTR